MSLGGHASGVFLVTRVSHEFGGLSSVCPVYYYIGREYAYFRQTNRYTEMLKAEEKIT